MTDKLTVPFKTLCHGARFTYIDGSKTWVKIGSDLIAEWDAKFVADSWIGQQLCSFSEDGNLNTLVNLIPEAPPTAPSVSHLTREQQIVAMADVLRECRWFKTPDGVPEDKQLIWATRMWKAANPASDNLPVIKALNWVESSTTLKAGMLDQHYLINPSKIIDHYRLSTPDGHDYFPTIEAAKAAAQIDLERRINSVFQRPTPSTSEQKGSYAAIHAHTVRKAALREDDNGNQHLAEELREAMRFIERAAAVDV
jgi:hypothetical protein